MNIRVNIRATRLAQVATAAMMCVMLFMTTACGTTSPSATTQGAPPSGPLSVVASVNQWGSLAEQIGGEDVRVTSILTSTAGDAHGFDPKTSDIALLQSARVAVVNGAGYDTWASRNLPDTVSTVSAADMVGASEADNPHLWFSKDARDAVAQALCDAFSTALPSKKGAFSSRLEKWRKREKALESAMSEFSRRQGKATYAATEAVAYYLMSDLGFENATPERYAQALASESEPAPGDLQEFQELLESHKVDLLITNSQESSDAANLLSGTAGRSDIPVVSISEQMPEDSSDLTDWIASLVTAIDTAVADGTGSGKDADTTDEGTDPSKTPTTGDPSTDQSGGQPPVDTPSNKGQTDPGK